MRSSVHLRLPRKPAGGPILPPASWAPRSEAAGALLRRVSFATWSTIIVAIMCYDYSLHHFGVRVFVWATTTHYGHALLLTFTCNRCTRRCQYQVSWSLCCLPR